jgi:hypothetical protein
VGGDILRGVSQEIAYPELPIFTSKFDSRTASVHILRRSELH